MIYFGWNQNQDASVEPYVSGCTMLRSFKGMSSTWPVMPRGLPSLWSPQPDPASLFAGQYDTEFFSAMASAPPGSKLSTWHEADHGTPPLLPASVAQQVHTYMHELVGRFNATQPPGSVPMTYGSVSTGGLHTRAWTVPGLDFYGVDMYDNLHDNHPAYHLNAWSDTQHPGPRVIAETNTSLEANRPYWFEHAFGWLEANDGIAFLTFWNPGGGLSGPFVPTDTNTIAALNAISAGASTA